MSEVTEYVANALLRVNRPGGVFIRRISMKGVARIATSVHDTNPPRRDLADWVHDEEIKALLDRGLIALRDSSCPS